MKYLAAPTGRYTKLLSVLFVAGFAAACARTAQPPQPQSPLEPANSISVPDRTFDILVAAADSVLPKLGPPDEKFYIDDPVTAKIFDHIGAGDRYSIIARDQLVPCDGSTSITRATMRVYGVFGDSASVAWSATCSMSGNAQSEPRVAGNGGTFELTKVGDAWAVVGSGMNFEFGSQPSGVSPADAVNTIATAFMRRRTEAGPESARSDTGWMKPLASRVTDNTQAAANRWHRYQDSVLAQLADIDTTKLAGKPEATTYSILRNNLESSIGTRVCRFGLWGVNSYVNGWQSQYTNVFSQQRTGTPERRKAALARARALPQYIDNEIINLREGKRLGYTSPAVIVANVIKQLDDLVAGEPTASPFYSPAERDTSKAQDASAFRKQLAAQIANEINPAIRRYRTFLATEYLAGARQSLAVTDNPGGEDCYRAVIRSFSTIDIPADSVFDLGAREMRRIDREMKEIARAHFGTEDVPSLLASFKTDPRYTFRSRQAVIDTSETAIARARAEMPKWFGIVPSFDVVIRPYPEFRQRAGAPGQLNVGAPGDRSSVFLINTWDPEHKSRSTNETVAFHEAIPGHHLQVGIATELKGMHPLVREAYNSGFGEGWALYAERLADEMGLFSSPLARMGMLESEAHRAARCLIDAGIHTRGWTRQQAIDTLAAHTAMDLRIIEAEVDRYISWPGQAPSYMLGRNEIFRLRQVAKDSLGNRFDIRQFHDRVLENGTVTLPMLGANIMKWIAASR